MNRYFKILTTLSFIILLQSCATTGKKPKSVHGDKPLIDTAKIIVEGRADMDKKIIDDLSLNELMEYWKRVKNEEK